VVIFRVELNVGSPDAGLKLAAAPEGNPEQLNDTDWAVPFNSLEVTVKVAADPAATFRDKGEVGTLNSNTGCPVVVSVCNPVLFQLP
jgi:hypothetical protein